MTDCFTIVRNDILLFAVIIYEAQMPSSTTCKSSGDFSFAPLHLRDSFLIFIHTHQVIDKNVHFKNCRAHPTRLTLNLNHISYEKDIPQPPVICIRYRYFCLHTAREIENPETVTVCNKSPERSQGQDFALLHFCNNL